MSPRRAVIYTRISLDLRDGEGVERQELACRELATRQGYEVVEVCSDNSISAYSGVIRPGFERVMELVTSGTVDVIVAWHLDRLLRSLQDLVRISSVRGLLVDFVRGQPLDTSDATSMLTGQIVAVISSFESSHKAERVIAAQMAKAAKGELLARPWGYEAGKPTDEARAAIPALFDVFVRTHNIEAARAEFMKLAPDAPASRGAIIGRLQQPAYAGIVEWRKVPFDVEPQWESLISREVFYRAQNILGSARRKVTHHERGVISALGTGLYVCGQCGKTMISGGVINTSRGRRVAYRCRSNSHMNRDRDDVDNAVMMLLLWRLGIPNVKTPILPRTSDETTPVAQMVRDLDASRHRLQLMHDDYAEGILDPAMARESIRKLRAEIEAMEVELASSGVDPTAPPRPHNVELTLLNLPLLALRQVLAAVMVVTLHPAQRGGTRKKGSVMGLRPGSLSVQWLTEPGADTAHASHERREWPVFTDDLPIPTPEGLDWVLDLLEGAPPLSDDVRAAVWRAIAPYAIGDDWDIDGEKERLLSHM